MMAAPAAKAEHASERTDPGVTAAAAKRIKLACALKTNGTLRFVTRARRCRRRTGTLVRLDPGPTDVCERRRGTRGGKLKAAAAPRVKRQLALCGRSRASNEKELTLPGARKEFFCVEKRSKVMRRARTRQRCRKRGRFAEFRGFVAKRVGDPGQTGGPPGGPGAGQPNRAPQSTADGATTGEGTPVAVAVLANDRDADGDPLGIGSIGTGATKGAARLGSAGRITYDPAGEFESLAPGETAADSFTYTARDPDGSLSAPARVNVTVTGANDAANVTAGGGALSTFTEDQAGDVSVDDGISVGDVDSDSLTGAKVAITGGRQSGDTLHFANTAQITGTYNSGTGVLTLAGTDSGAGYEDALRSIRFSTSNQNPGATRTVAFRADDGSGLSAPATRQVVVTPVNDAPVAEDDDVSGASRAVGNTSLVLNDPSDAAPNPAGPQKTATGDVLANDDDVDGPALAVVPGTYPTLDGGEVLMEADGDFTYRPPQGCTGGADDTFQYTVTDNHPSDPLTATPKASITIADCVWYVDDSAAAGGDGRSNAPYNSLTPLAGTVEDDPGHTIFVYDGNYTGGLALENNQGLFSERHGLTVPSGSSPPGTVSLEPADGAGADLQGGLVLASGNSVQGVDLGNTAGFALSGSSVGTAKVGNETVGDIDNDTGGAVAIDGSGNSLAMAFGTLSSTGSATNAMRLTNATGSFTASTGVLENATGTTVSLNGGSADVTLGVLTSDQVGQAVQIQNKTGGTNDFNGQISGGGVSLTSNAGATTRFDGGFFLQTQTANGLVASNGGTLAITDANGPNTQPNNRVFTSTGTPVSLTSSTTIHEDDVTFDRIASDGAPSGIVLNGTGSTGQFRVTGSGGTCTVVGTCTGGAIENSTGAGISLTSVPGGVDITRLIVTSGDNDGIRGTTVNDFALRNSSITNNGDAAGESGLDFTGLTGTVALDSDTVTGNATFNVTVGNTSGTLGMTVTGGSYGNTSTTLGEDGILVDANNTASQTLLVDGSAFTDNRGDHVQASTGSTGTPRQDVSIVDATMTSTVANLPNILGGGITISPAGGASVDATIDETDIQNAKSNAIRVDTTGSATGNLDTTITDNIIGTEGTARSGSFSANGILLGANGAATVDALISGNQIREYTNTHGLLLSQGSGATAKINATITNNTFANPSTALGGAGGVKAQAGLTSGDAGVMCLDLGGSGAGNNLGAAGNPDTGETSDIRVQQAFSAAIQFPQLGGTTTPAAVETYLEGRNLGTPNASAVASSGTGFQNTTSACPQPTPGP
jgi:hypothetical protein